MDGELSKTECELLKWLSEDEFSQYGECYGPTLDALIAKGYVEVHNDIESQGRFIVTGDGPMYQAVSLTDAGSALARELRKQ